MAEAYVQTIGAPAPPGSRPALSTSTSAATRAIGSTLRAAAPILATAAGSTLNSKLAITTRTGPTGIFGTGRSERLSPKKSVAMARIIGEADCSYVRRSLRGHVSPDRFHMWIWLKDFGQRKTRYPIGIAG